MPEKSRLMPISYYNPKQEIRLSAYADTIVLEPDGREQHLRAIRFGGYPEMVRAMSDAIYAGATLETEFAGEPAMLACEPKKYECHLSHDGIYAEATILSLDDADTAAKKDEDAQADSIFGRSASAGIRRWYAPCRTRSTPVRRWKRNLPVKQPCSPANRRNTNAI